MHLGCYCAVIVPAYAQLLVAQPTIYLGLRRKFLRGIMSSPFCASVIQAKWHGQNPSSKCILNLGLKWCFQTDLPTARGTGFQNVPVSRSTARQVWKSVVGGSWRHGSAWQRAPRHQRLVRDHQGSEVHSKLCESRDICLSKRSLCL